MRVDDRLPDTGPGEALGDVRERRAITDWHEGLGEQVGERAEPRPEAGRQDHCAGRGRHA
jgi:hypothetical protein